MSQILTAWPKVCADVGAIKKGQRNQQQRYNFRGIDDVMAALHGPMVKHGVSMSSKVKDYSVTSSERTSKSGQPQMVVHAVILMQYRVTAEDNSYLTFEAVGESIDYQDKASNQAMSQAFKMAMLQGLVAPTDDIDPDARSPHMEAEVQEAEVVEPNWEAVAKRRALEMVGGEDREAAKQLYTEAVTAAKVKAVASENQITDQNVGI